jgi:hypothetical protein
MRPEEAQKRYSDTIEAAIAKAKASGELERVRAPGPGRSLRLSAPARHRLGRERGRERR